MQLITNVPSLKSSRQAGLTQVSNAARDMSICRLPRAACQAFSGVNSIAASIKTSLPTKLQFVKYPKYWRFPGPIISKDVFHIPCKRQASKAFLFNQRQRQRLRHRLRPVSKLSAASQHCRRRSFHSKKASSIFLRHEKPTDSSTLK